MGPGTGTATTGADATNVWKHVGQNIHTTRHGVRPTGSICDRKNVKKEWKAVTSIFIQRDLVHRGGGGPCSMCGLVGTHAHMEPEVERLREEITTKLESWWELEVDE
jgi:hypothetical protein